jgi:hypothetical protein
VFRAPSRTCLQCGHSQEEGEFCEVCGTPLVTQPAAAPPPSVAPGPPPVAPTMAAAAVPPPPGVMGAPSPPPQYAPPPPQYAPPPTYGPPPTYASPPPYGGSGYVPPSSQPEGFFGRLFDFSFDHFVTPSIIKVLFILILVVIGLGALGMIIAGFTQGALTGLLTLIIAVPIGGFLYILFARVWLEIIVVLFRIEEHVATIAESARRK